MYAILSLALAALPAAVDTVVVCPKQFESALAPWLDYRRAEGHEIAVVSNAGSRDQIRARIRAIAKGTLRFVLLVGDAQGATDKGQHLGLVPAHFAMAQVNRYWGSEPEIATDNWYADLDDDQAPDLAIGRLTADTPAQLVTIVQKILAYERSDDHDSWRRRVNFVAGLGGFGTLVDAAVEAATKTILTEGIPASYVTSMTYANWQSPYCPDPRTFNDVAVGRLNEGCFFWVYIGHGQKELVDLLKAPDGLYPIFGKRDVARLRPAHGSPIALFLSCYTGAFDGSEDCLAEDLLRAPGGPVGVICGSRVTMPYAMSVLGASLMDECFHNSRATVGELVLHAKRRMVFDPRTDERSRQMDALAAAINPIKTDLAEERREHVLLFNLIGDPLLRIRLPKAIELSAINETEAGGTLEVSGTSPVDGEADVELAVRRDRLTFRPASRRSYENTSQAQSERQRTYERANDARLSVGKATVKDGRFQASLPIPADAWGDCHVRVFARGPDGFASGSRDVVIRRPDRQAARSRAAGK